MRSLLAAIALLGLCASAARAVTPAEEAAITSPYWVSKPAGEDVSRHYPKKAQRLEVEGRATITCRVRTDGALEGCVVVHEEPAGYGFGEAALKLAPQFRLMPSTENGTPVAGAKVTVPLNFRLPDDEDLIGLSPTGFLWAVAAGSFGLAALLLGALIAATVRLGRGRRTSGQA